MSGQLHTKGRVRINDFGLAIRHNMGRQSAFYFADAGSKSGYAAQAVGECSYKVFLDVGGPAKTPGVTPNNEFSVSFLAFPGSSSGDTSEDSIKRGVRLQLSQISQAGNSFELPLLMGFAGMVGRGKSGLDGLKAFRKMSADDKSKGLPTNYLNIVFGLTAYGFRGDMVSRAVGGIADAAAAVANTLP